MIKNHGRKQDYLYRYFTGGVMMDKRIYVLLGGSGTGKTTLGIYLKELGIPEIVSHTTRKKRPGEIEGVTYYYVSKDEFDKIEKIELVEYAGNYYCISKKEIENKLKQSDKLFVICDINGLKQLKKHYPEEVRVIYIYLPLDEMEGRLRKRGEDEETIQKRLNKAVESGELNNIVHADYVIINKELEESKKLIRTIVNL